MWKTIKIRIYLVSEIGVLRNVRKYCTVLLVNLLNIPLGAR